MKVLLLRICLSTRLPLIGLKDTFSPTDPGTIEYYYDWTYTFYGDTAGLGKIPFLECIARSSDVCFYKVGGGYPGEVPEGWTCCVFSNMHRRLATTSQPVSSSGRSCRPCPDPTWNLAWITATHFIKAHITGARNAFPGRNLSQSSRISVKRVGPIVIIFNGAGSVGENVSFKPIMEGASISISG